MKEPIRVAILDDHQGIIDGYLFRLEKTSDIEVVATLTYGEQLEPAIKRYEPDVLILDVSVPTSPQNPNPFPVLYIIPKLLESYKNLSILIISCNPQRLLVERAIQCGVSGYILKDDQESIRELPSIIRMVLHGGLALSKKITTDLFKSATSELHQPLSPRQIEALSLCAAFPEATSGDLAEKMGIAQSTIRNLLSGAYLKLEVASRTAAVAKARHLGIITPEEPIPNIATLEKDINLKNQAIQE